jgi:hypothetical protein
MPIFDEVPDPPPATERLPTKPPFRLHWLAVLSLMLAAYLAGRASAREGGLADARRECCERWSNGFDMSRTCPARAP